MEYRVLGRTGLRVSRIGFGVYSLTGLYGSVSEEEALELLRYAERLGVNFYDTADVYGNGLGEELLCRAFGERGVWRLVVATKIGYDIYSGKTPPPRRYDVGYLLYAAERSAERLCKKPIDLIQIHNPPLNILRSRQLWRAMEKLLDEGYARAVGVALGPESDVLEHALAALNTGKPHSLQFVYNMLEQEPGATIARIAAAAGVVAIARVPHAGGVLDETVKPGGEQSLSDHRTLRRRGWYQWAFSLYEKMKKLLADMPGTPGQKAIRFILDSTPVDAVVVAAKSRAQLREYVEALKLEPLDRDVVAALRKLYLEAVEYSPEKPEKSLKLLQNLQEQPTAKAPV